MDTAYCYDKMNRLTEERREGSGDKYSYDLAGNRIRKQSGYYALISGGETAGNQAGSIINTVNSMAIDGEETYCYNERNELTERKTLSAVTQYLYDVNGSLVREKEGSKTTSYQYDLLNRQTHIKMPDGREQESFYDGEGLRAGLKENGEASTFIFYNGEILAECDENSRPVKRHLQGLGLSCVQTLNDDVYHAYYQDEQGSTAYITGYDGVVENSYLYDAFGNVLAGKEIIENRILYTGQQYDQEAGQYYLRARFYNPVIGRFTQEDTYRGDGLNLYAYCANNPVMYYDPSGHDKQPDQAGSEKQKSAGESGTPSENYVYRALNQKDYERYTKGLGLEAKNPNGNWDLKEHLVDGSGKLSWANDPYISTTSDLNVANGFNQSGSGYGIVKIDMNKVTSPSYKGYEIYPRVNGKEGLPYHYSVWQQETSVYQSIPFEAIVDYFN